MKKTCSKCGDRIATEGTSANGICGRCEQRAAFAKFAAECGLAMYPDPDGERYLNDVDGENSCKKGECVEFMDELWNALALARGRKDLFIGGTS